LLALKPLEQDGPAKGLHSNPEELLAVGLPKAEAVDGKPPKDQPVFWHWEDLRSWLESPGQAGPGTVMARGEKALVQDRRVSVAIRSDSGTYVDGALFEVASLAFRSGSPKQLEDAQEFSLLMATDTTKPLPEGIGFLGGKNRLVAWAKAPSGLWPECPEAVLKSVAATGRCRILLATPGVFTAGWQPEWLLQAREGVTPVLKAALVTRPETFSGWDYAANQGKGQPKATRRAVASGCVYWLELAGSGSQREAWVKSVWLESVSDVEQDRLDGFGLALVGVWA
jgi:CRISPR-associated protein Cmr3